MTVHFRRRLDQLTDGPARTLHLSDGWYVAGAGMLIPVRDEAEADEVVAEARKRAAATKSGSVE